MFDKKCTCENFQQNEDCEHIGNKILEEVGMQVEDSMGSYHIANTHIEEVGLGVGDKDCPEAYRLARRFHEFYEQSAPAFGYITNPNTREFYPNSNNGRLMAWVCYEIIKEEKQELLKKLKATFLETSTIGQHTLDVFNNYVNGLDLFDDDF